jgi:uncharacterized protein (TIGR02145 family)
MKNLILVVIVVFFVIPSISSQCIGSACCTNGSYWDPLTAACVAPLQGDFDGDGCVSTIDLMSFLSLFGSCQSTFSCGNNVLHDGYSYSTIQIGNQCWFSENCRYLPSVSPSTESSYTDPLYYVYNYQGIDEYDASSTSEYIDYGTLYNHKAIITPGICPSGWHIPTDSEFMELEMFLDMSQVDASSSGWRGVDQEGDKLKSNVGWNAGGNGSNSSAFTALPGGHLIFSSIPMYNGFGDLGTGGNWWTLPEIGETTTYRRHLKYNTDQIYKDTYSKISGFSARCIKGHGPQYIYGCTDPDACNYFCLANSDDGSCFSIGDSCDDGDPNTTDDLIRSDCNCAGIGTAPWAPFAMCGDDILHEGYAYSTTIVGDQCWFAENCRYLPDVSPITVESSTTPVYYVYDYQGIDATVAKASYNYNKYGVLYNWPAVMTSEICPTGWHIPEQNDFFNLYNYVSANTTTAQLGESLASTWDWTTWPGACGSANGTDDYGFEWTPSGSADHIAGSHEFGGMIPTQNPVAGGPIHENTFIRSTTDYVLFTGTDCMSLNQDPTTSGTWSERTKNTGLATRCLRDDATAVGCMTLGACNYDPTASIQGPCIVGGGTCNDGDPNTFNDTYDSNCSCSGTTSIPFQNCGDDKYYEGHFYSTVEIGTDCWFAENCRYLPSVKDYSNGYTSHTTPYHYVYGYNGDYVVDAMAEQNYIDYGALYNFASVTNDDLCPSGWHIPSKPEFDNLVAAVGGVGVAGLHLKSGAPAWDGDNTSKYSGLPGGVVWDVYELLLGDVGQWWSTTQAVAGGVSGGETLQLIQGAPDIDPNVTIPEPGDYGLSARCVKD